MTVQKEWKAYGLLCRVLDNNFGTFNGYVAVPVGHPMFAADYNDLLVDVHGGLTFGEMGSEKSENWPNPALWWFGFDTCHSGDWVDHAPERGGRRWTLEDVEKETENLAKQISESKHKYFFDYSTRYDIKKHFGEDFLEAMLLGDRSTMAEILSRNTHETRPQEET